MNDPRDIPTVSKKSPESAPPRKRRAVVEASGSISDLGAAVMRAGLEIERERRETGAGSHPVPFTYQVTDLGPELQPEPPKPPPKPSAT